MGCALLDIDEPWKVKYRTKDYIMAPITQYECMGDVPNVVFPVRNLKRCSKPEESLSTTDAQIL